MGKTEDYLDFGRSIPAKKGWQYLVLVGLALSCLYAVLPPSFFPFSLSSQHVSVKLTNSQQATLQASIDRCNAINLPAGPPSDFAKRVRSDRAIEKSPPLLLKNVTLWTGKPEEGDGFGQVLERVSIHAKDGIIQSIYKDEEHKSFSNDTIEIQGHGRWVTPGIIDIHVHVGLDLLPALRGADDTNSLKSPVTPALRSLDGISNHDWGFISIASGGVTSGLALPGSANNVGGQAFPVKMGRLGRKAASSGGWSRVIDPPRSLVLPGEGEVGRDGLYDEETGMKRGDGSSSFRYMKMACGENARRLYKLTRMDEALNFRQLFDQARTLKSKQDIFCEKALRDKGRTLQDQVTFPDDLALEAVVDVLRGKVKVNTHCYTLEDFSSFVSHTNEFKFPLAAFHHSHEAYLAPDLLKKVYGGTPAVALFSVNANYKTEAYFGSPFAAAILAANNITSISKSDHPVTDSRRLISQVAQSHHFGLSAGKALRGVTSSAARILGLDHRIGQVKLGFDADLVLWNKNPLALGAKPVEVIIDGTRQQLKIDDTYAPLTAGEETFNSSPPPSANFTAEIQRVSNSGPEIMAWESSGFPIPKRRVSSVRLFNVSRVFSLHGVKGEKRIKSTRILEEESVLLSDGKISCIGHSKSCPEVLDAEEHIDLKGGTVMPGLIAFGSNLGLTDIVAEPATKDGSSEALIDSNTARAVDGLRLGGNDLQFAHSSGIRTVVSAPESKEGIKQGIATQFDAGVEDLFEKGAIRKKEVALHLTIDHWQASDSKQPTVGQQIASIRSALQKAEEAITLSREKGDKEKREDIDGDIWHRVAKGTLPLIVNVKQAESIAQLIFIKEAFPKVILILSSVEEASFASLPFHLKEAKIPVLINPITWAQVYDARRALRIKGIQASSSSSSTTVSHQSSSSSLLGILLKEGVQVGVMINEAYRAVTLLWDIVSAGEEAGISYEQSLELATSSLANILDIDVGEDTVAFDGSLFEYGSRPVAIATPRGIDLMDN